MKKPISETEPLSLMISSRCADTVEFEGKLQSMKVVRLAMKSRPEAIHIGGKPVFKVWVHEDESNASGLTSTWDQCMEKFRMSFRKRREAMTHAVVGLLQKRSGSRKSSSPKNLAVVNVGAENIGFLCDSVPGPVSTAATRELVGQPFLRDAHHTATWPSDVHGPVPMPPLHQGFQSSRRVGDEPVGPSDYRIIHGC